MPAQVLGLVGLVGERARDAEVVGFNAVKVGLRKTIHLLVSTVGDGHIAQPGVFGDGLAGGVVFAEQVTGVIVGEMP